MKPTSDTLKYFKIESEELLEVLYSAAARLEDSKEPTELLKEMRRAAHSLKGAARLVELYPVADVAHSLEDLLVSFSGQKRVEANALLPTLDTLAKAISQGLREPNDAPAEERAPRDTGSSILDSGVTKVETVILDEIARRVAQLREIGERVASSASIFDKIVREVSSIKDEGGDLTQVRDIRKLRELLHQDLALVRTASRSVHSLVLRAKMMAFNEVRHRYEKLVRETARETGKECKLTIRGGDSLLDQRIIQRLSEPIAHLLRNAVCHGIENQEGRRHARKQLQGEVTIDVERKDDRILLTITDDGRGICRDEVITKARKLGVNLSPEVAIFLPGFSTSAEVTDLSGRGIGLDVVRGAIESLGGELKVQSAQGEGTTFILSIPTIIDLAEVFQVGIGQQRFLLPLKSVEKVARVQELEQAARDGQPGVWLGKEALKLTHGKALLGISSIDEENEPCSYVVILSGGSQRMALLVTTVLGRQQVVIKGLNSHLRSNPLLAGGGITTEGKVAFLLRPKALIERQEARSFFPPLCERSEVDEKHSILVVDDSLTTRMLEKTVLDAAGYRTTLACNGAEALKELENNRFDLIIVDFEMPEMDGINLTRRIRETSEFSRVPIIMLTSRGDDEDKKKGLLAGVQAYLVKGNFDQNHFLSVVQDLIAMEGE